MSNLPHPSELTAATQFPSAAHPPRQYRYYDMIMVAFVTVLIGSEFISASKIATVGGYAFGAGVIFFPLSYIFGDILTEVYGYQRSRKVIWAGFGSLIFLTIMAWFVLTLPPASFWVDKATGQSNQAAWEAVFGNSWRIVGASLLAFVIGEWVNSVVLAKMKVMTSGKHLWARTIGSTIAGEAVDSIIFYPLAFLGIWETPAVVTVMITNYLLKVTTEVVLTPLTYLVVNWLKKAENEDFYDVGTDFSLISRG